MAVNLQQQFQHTIALMDEMYDRGVVPGMSWEIFAGPQHLRQVVGQAQLVPQAAPLKPGMFYDLASLTKVVGTLPVIGQLLQSGRLNLDDPVKAYLPEVGEGATVRNLVTHTAAIEGYIPHRNELPRQELLQALLSQEHFGHNVNRNIAYTDIGFIYLGLIAERICGRPIQDLVTDMVIKPLGLEDEMTYHPDASRCVPTAISPQRGLIKGVPHDPKAYVLGSQCGSAGLFATLDGLSHYAHALIEDNLDGLLQKRIIDLMFADQTRLPGLHNRALGWKLMHAASPDHHALISHTGFTGTWIILDRQADVGFIFLSNRVHPHSQNDAFLDYRAQIMAAYLTDLR